MEGSGAHGGLRRLKLIIFEGSTGPGAQEEPMEEHTLWLFAQN